MDRPKRPPSERDRKFIAGIYRFLAALWFGVPLLVIAAYYVFGWQAAVLALPAMLISLLARSGPVGEARPRRSRFAGLLVLLALWAIPIFAVATGNAEFMRLWAYAMVVPIAVFGGVGRDSGKPDNATGRASLFLQVATWFIAALIFVAASEVIWRLFSFGVWIWFHAFGMTIIILLLTFTRLALERFIGATTTGFDV